MIPNVPALFEACLEYEAYRHPWRGASLEDKSPEARAIRQTAHRYEEMKSRLESAWAAYYGLIEAGGDRSWDRLVGKLHTGDVATEIWITHQIVITRRCGA